LKREWWESPLVQEKYREEQACDKRYPYRVIVIIIPKMTLLSAAQVIPTVISSTAVIPKSLPQSLTTLNLHPNTYKQLQKSVILGTCSTVRHFLNYK